MTLHLEELETRSTQLSAIGVHLQRQNRSLKEAAAADVAATATARAAAIAAKTATATAAATAAAAAAEASTTLHQLGGIVFEGLQSAEGSGAHDTVLVFECLWFAVFGRSWRSETRPIVRPSIRRSHVAKDQNKVN